MTSSNAFPILIGFIGQGGAGKTESAKIASKFLYNAYHHPKILSIAHPLKVEAAQEHGYGEDWAKFKSEKPEEYRRYCVIEGQRKRAEDPDYWLVRWKATLDNFAARQTEFPKVVLVDDVRFDNEMALITSLGGILVYVDGSSRLKDEPFRHEEPEALSNGLAKVFPYRVKKPNDAWSVFQQSNMIKFCIDNNRSLSRLSMRVSELVMGWTAPVDVVLSNDNPFLYAYMRDYQVAYNTLSNAHKKEVHNCGFDEDLIFRYAARHATRPSRN